MGTACPKFVEKAFAGGSKTAKFVNVFFLKSFLLYGMQLDFVLMVSVLMSSVVIPHTEIEKLLSTIDNKTLSKTTLYSCMPPTMYAPSPPSLPPLPHMHTNNTHTAHAQMQAPPPTHVVVIVVT